MTPWDGGYHAQLHLTKPELRYCSSSNPGCGASEIYNGESR